MLAKAYDIKTGLFCLLLVHCLPGIGQKKWESNIFWNNTNINLFNYDLLESSEPEVFFKERAIDSPINRTHVWIAGDSLVAYIYPNRLKASYGGKLKFEQKFATASFLDSAFLRNSFPLRAQQLVTIKINESVILNNADFNEILAMERVWNENLESVKVKDRIFLLLHLKLYKTDSVTISTRDRQTRKLFDEYKLFKTDPFPRIIASYDLSRKEQFGQLMLKRDSLQLTLPATIKNPDTAIAVSPLHNDLLLLLKRFNEADTLRVEYRLLKSGNQQDTSWSITENEIPVIQFNNLERGGKYTLQLRYNLTPHVIKSYAIEVGIYWWQVIYIQVLLAFLGGVLLTGLGWMLYKRKKEKQLTYKEEKRKQLELQLQSVRAQLNPHFIFNSMATLQSLINQREIENANIYLGRVSKLMRSTLENSTKLLATLDEELEYLNNYLQIEAIRFEFGYKVEVGEDVPLHDIEIPAMFIQPVVENAIKHGLAAKPNGCLLISIARLDHDLILTVQDNGPGFSDGARHGRFGLHLTFERIRLLNQILIPRQIIFNIENVPGAVKCIFKFEKWI